jgi:hypothetical protein
MAEPNRDAEQKAVKQKAEDAIRWWNWTIPIGALIVAAPAYLILTNSTISNNPKSYVFALDAKTG